MTAAALAIVTVGAVQLGGPTLADAAVRTTHQCTEGTGLPGRPTYLYYGPGRSQYYSAAVYNRTMLKLGVKHGDFWWVRPTPIDNGSVSGWVHKNDIGPC